MKHLLTLVIIGLLLSPHVFAADGQIVQQLSANGSRNTRPFTVKDGWEIQWENKGSMLTVSVYTAAGKPVAGGGLTTTPGNGQSFQPKGGTYYLDIMGTGEWTVTVVQLP